VKILISLIFLSVALLTGCRGFLQSVEINATATGVEVTRVVQITTTPIPTKTITSTPTISPADRSMTAIARQIGTAIVASDECYRTAQTQRDLNTCAARRIEELEIHMAELLKKVEFHYRAGSQESLEKFQSIQAEWKDLSHRECRLSSGLDGDGWPGTMAPLNYGECMVSKYEDRLREFQVQIFSWSH